MPLKSQNKKNLTAGQKKLLSLGIQLPLYPMTTTGSFPKQSELTEMKYRVSKGFQNAGELTRKERLTTDHWIQQQEQMNLDILVEGEMERADMISFFAERISGFESGGIVRCYGNRYYRKPVIKNKLLWTKPIVVDFWRISQRSTHKPVKAILTGPYTLMDWAFNEYYNSREAALKDMTAVIRKEVEALEEAGAKFIQFDEPAISSRPIDFPLISEAYRTITEDIAAYFILHHCYGDLDSVWPKLQRLPVDNLDIETANSNFSILPLIKKYPAKKDITIGVIDAHRHEIESPSQITSRLKSALRVIPAAQLWVAPDCGLKTRIPVEARRKLLAMSQAVLKLRAKKRT